MKEGTHMHCSAGVISVHSILTNGIIIIFQESTKIKAKLALGNWLENGFFPQSDLALHVRMN